MCLIVNGGVPIFGEVKISGAKNSALPSIAASILTDEKIVLKNCPRISDVFNMSDIIAALGGKVNFTKDTLCLDTSGMFLSTMPCALSEKLRSSIFALGAMVARRGKAEFFYPGGCDIGARPIDLHLYALSRLGVAISEFDDRIICECEKLHGGNISLKFPSVGATENAMLAASLAVGDTVIENAAREPEIVDLAHLLIKMGADITGAGTQTIRISGRERLHGATHTLIPDRIEAATFLCALTIAGGEIALNNVIPEHLESTIFAFRSAGLEIETAQDNIHAKMEKRPKPFNIKTGVYPKLPTDIQALLCAVACVADGNSRIVENIFENRMRHVYELTKCGSEFRVCENECAISGTQNPCPAKFKATDLRAGAAMVCLALGIHGRSKVENTALIERGYERFCEKLCALGADVR